MNKQKFYETVNKLGIYKKKTMVGKHYPYKLQTVPEFVECRRLVGGHTGASCWDDSPSDRPVSADPPEPFTDLDTILEAVCPNLTFLQYKRLERDVVKVDEESDGDYYGNAYIYEIKRVTLDELYDWLQKNKLLPA